MNTDRDVSEVESGADEPEFLGYSDDGMAIYRLKFEL